MPSFENPPASAVGSVRLDIQPLTEFYARYLPLEAEGELFLCDFLLKHYPLENS